MFMAKILDVGRVSNFLKFVSILLILALREGISEICGEGFQPLIKTCYRVYGSTEKASWEDAYNTCRSQLSELLQFDGSILTEDIEELFNKLGKNEYYWLGLRRGPGHYFQWVGTNPQLLIKSIEEPALSRWATNEPTRWNHECVNIHAASKTFSSYLCNTKSSFVCLRPQLTESLEEHVPFCEKGWLAHPLIPNRCLLINTETLTWREAESYCQLEGVNASLLSERTYTTLKPFRDQLDPSSEGVWLSKSTGECITSASSNKVSCDKPTRSVCEVNISPDLFKIRLRAIVTTSGNEEDSVVWVDPAAASRLHLICEVEISNRVIELTNPKWIRYHWVKNGNYMNISDRLFYPKHWRTPTPFTAFYGGNISYEEGTFHCEVDIYALEQRLVSKTVTVLSTSPSTSLVNITVSLNKSVVVKELELSSASFTQLLKWNETVANVFSDIVLPVEGNPRKWWTLNIIRPVDTEISSAKILSVVLMGLVFVSTTENYIAQNLSFVSNKESRKKDYTILKISSQKLDSCLDESYTHGKVTYEWTMSPGMSKSYSDPRCISRSYPHQSVARECKIDFQDGVRWESFDYDQCSESIEISEFCPPGFHSVDNKTCIKEYVTVEERASYLEALKECSRQNATLSLPYGNENFTDMWMNGETNGDLLLQIHFGVNAVTLPKSLCPIFHNLREQPVMKYIDCSDKLPFICSIPRRMDSYAEVPWCHQGWLGLDWLHDASCYYFHTQADTIRKEAVDRCQSRDSHLATAIDQPTRQRLLKTVEVLKQQNAISDGFEAFWVGLVKTNSGLFWNSSSASFKDSELNISTNSSNDIMGILRVKRLTFNLTGSTRKYGYICQKPVATERNPRISLQKIEEAVSGTKRIKLICVGRRVHTNSFVLWYLNGDLINTDPRLKGNDNVTVSVVNLLPSGRMTAELQFPLVSLSRQGQYQCEFRGISPYPTVISNKVLVALDKNSSIILKLETETQRNGTQELFQFLHNCTTENFQIEEIRRFNKSKFEEFFIRIERPEKSSDEWKRFENCISSLNRTFSFIRSAEFRHPYVCWEERTEDLFDWPSTTLGSIALPKQLCFSKNGSYATRECIGDYVHGAKWSNVHGVCEQSGSSVSLSLRLLSQSNVTHQSVSQTSSDLLYLTKTAQNLHPLDVLYIAETMQKISNVENVTEAVVTNAAKTVDCILNIDDENLINSNMKSNSSTRISEAFEKILDNLQYEGNSPLLLNLSSVRIETFIPYKDPLIGMAAINESDVFNGKRQILPIRSMDQLNLAKTDAALLLPKNLLEFQKPDDRVTFIFYDNNRLFPVRDTSSIRRSKVMINSRVISAKVPRSYALRLTPPITLVFRPLKPSTANFDNISCVFWDYSLNNGSGDWSEDGCWISEIKSECIVCQCNHLTNFAVLMEIDDQHSSLEEDHRIALDIITYIGCSLSILGLVLTIATFAIFKKWRKKDGNKVLCNMSISLLCVLVIFLGGIEQIEHPTVCLCVAVLLHYFLLSTFCWMLVEAVLQYLMFVRVFDTYIPRFIIKAMTFAWGTPLIIVGVILAIDTNLYHGEHSFCWMGPKAQYYGFLFPLGVIVLTNTIVFIRVLKGISCDRKSALRSNQSKRQLAIVQFNAAACIFVLLGLSWIFGFMTITRTNVVFHYLFCISNSLQGVAIFVFMVLRDKNAKDLWYAFVLTSKRTKPSLTMSSVRSTSSSGTKSNGYIRRG